MRQTAPILDLTDEMKKGPVYRRLVAAESVCFVGDSLTEGTMNGGVPWYAPLQPLLRGKVFNISQGGATIKLLRAYFLEEITGTAADCFVIAVGANDILFRDPAFCVVTAADYIRQLQALRDDVRAQRPDAGFVFIAPWLATEGDASVIGLPEPPECGGVYADYTAALQRWCRETGDVFVNANAFLARQFSREKASTYLVDFIHPNAGAGVRLYARAVLLYGGDDEG